MKYDLFIRVALAEDLPERHLHRGDVATIVEQHAGRPGQDGPVVRTAEELRQFIADKELQQAKEAASREKPPQMPDKP
ncbi:MAG TPA: DUF4926 domain-containing protein [Methylomirabilota bacterium]|nr:DUF4926 domain-containing protein [Methylomirabilota bacterium]